MAAVTPSHVRIAQYRLVAGMEVGFDVTTAPRRHPIHDVIDGAIALAIILFRTHRIFADFLPSLPMA